MAHRAQHLKLPHESAEHACTGTKNEENNTSEYSAGQKYRQQSGSNLRILNFGDFHSVIWQIL
jgi:hypothetical protein